MSQTYNKLEELTVSQRQMICHSWDMSERHLRRLLHKPETFLGIQSFEECFKEYYVNTSDVLESHLMPCVDDERAVISFIVHHVNHKQWFNATFSNDPECKLINDEVYILYI